MAAKTSAKTKKKVPLKRRIQRKKKAISKYIRYKWVLPLVFKWYSRQPIDENLVVFADGRDRDMPDNFLSLYEMCQEKGYHCEVLSGKPFGKSVPPKQRNKESRRFQIQFMKYYAQCRTMFLVEYLGLAYIVPPREGTDIVQLWHACGMIKNIAYAAYGTTWSKSTLSKKALKTYPMHNTYTLVCAASPRLCTYYQRSFRCAPEITQPLGCPRTDIYYDEEFKQNALKKLHTLIPDLGNRKVVVYAPTFRGPSIARSYLDCNLDFKAMADELADDYVFVAKFHPLLAKGGITEADRLHALGFLYDLSKSLTPEEAVCVADIMISDYSSIMYDFLIYERPIISYIYDIDKYISDRGIVDPFEELAPGPYVFNQEELTEAIRTVDDWFDAEKTHRYREEFMCACDGHSTERIFNYVFNNKKDVIEEG